MRAFAALLCIQQFQKPINIEPPTVDTTSGLVQGFINNTTPSVEQYLGIPFAEQPIGARRWLPPLPRSKQGTKVFATRFGHACPQFEDDAPSIYLQDAPKFIISPQSHQGEDCLSINIWTPFGDTKSPRSTNELLPVIAWMYGGAFQRGGGTVPYQDPSRWVERSRKHIVVGINYRVGIFGFPNAAGLHSHEQNLGLLDQRLGLEWIRDNIANFGGDPGRIVLYGQSAGAISADYHNFAYPEDPVVSGFIMNSGSAFLPLISTDIEQRNFASIVRHFGCSDADAKREVDCLRNVSAASIVSFVRAQPKTGITLSFPFVPVIDNRTVFSDYTARALAGNFTRKPAIIGTTTNEGAAFVPYNRTHGPSQITADTATARLFLCPLVKTTQDRYASNATTFRYLYGGNFSNISPQWWEGAYHTSDLPLIFGTYGIARGEGTVFQREVSEEMQDLWLAFAEDPVNSLPAKGWKSYEPGGDAVLFGHHGRSIQPIKESSLELPCNGTIPNGRPLPP